VTPKVEARQDEVTRYHRSTSILVSAMIAFVTVLTLLVFTGILSFDARGADPTLLWALRITIVILGLGAITLRRTRFASARLQDIASLRGTTGLLSTLQQTTILVAAIGEAIAVLGFAMTLMTGDRFDMLRAGVISVAVLFYAYPRRGAWEREVQLTSAGGDGGDDVAASSPTKGTLA